MFGFGNNDYGQLGHGTNVNDQGLGHVTGLPVDVRQIAAGGNTSAALLPDGTVWMWGAALNGMSSGTVPVRVPGLTLAFNLCCLPGNFLPVLSGVSL